MAAWVTLRCSKISAALVLILSTDYQGISIECVIQQKKTIQIYQKLLPSMENHTGHVFEEALYMRDPDSSKKASFQPTSKL